MAEKVLKITGENVEISDGYHTFSELYDHRIELYIQLCGMLAEHTDYFIWKSAYDSDYVAQAGWFVLGIHETPGEQITYHLPMDRWKDCDFAVELEKAPKWDGHTSVDVLQRLRML